MKIVELANSLDLDEAVHLAARSGSSVVDHTLDYQSRDHKINPLLLWSFSETLNKDPISV